MHCFSLIICPLTGARRSTNRFAVDNAKIVYMLNHLWAKSSMELRVRTQDADIV